ncbi:MAG: hypothetical protein KDI75_05980, partial [Xanthomonadales bacterium]|nr:hypothetical protein [Xanthomonadales bacterium]
TPGYFHIVLRSQLPPTAAATLLKETMGKVDTAAPVYDIAALSAEIADSLATRRLVLWLLGSFALLGTFLAAVGVYGVMAQTLGRRRREIGLRAALGAGGVHLLGWALRLGAVPVLGGAAVGFALAVVGGRGLGDALVGVSVHDPQALVGALLGVLACAVAAILLPALRAMRTPPNEVLREQ